MCKVPFSRNKKRLDSFQIFAPKLFNCMPSEIRNMNGKLEDFKVLLDGFLTKIPDEPKCQGLVPGAMSSIDANPSNSLLFQVPRAWREGLTTGWMRNLVPVDGEQRPRAPGC